MTDVTALLTALTGVAAFNIDGMTLHSGLLLSIGRFGYQPLSSEMLNTLRSKLSKLMLIIIDEVSMVGSNMQLEIHRRLQQIRGVPGDVMFGGVSILAVGDLYQLPPVGQPPVFASVTDGYARLYASGSLWKEQFQMIQLSEVMRQKGDSRFIELLGRVRESKCIPQDIELLQSRVISSEDPGYPEDALHVYRLNTQVDKRNEEMLNSLAPEDQQYSIKSFDSIGSQTNHMSLSTISKKRTETGGLHHILKIAIGARIMLTSNVDVSDGLVNGARGQVVHIVTTNDAISRVLLKFDNPSIGSKSLQNSTNRSAYPDAVVLKRNETTFLAKGKKGSEVTRLQFPLTLAWATTIHKVQGLTLDKIVVDMSGGNRFNPGQAYVAFSRVKTLEGLYLHNFDKISIKCSDQVSNEMDRLNTKLIESKVPVSLSLCDTHIIYALINVRCLCAKLDNISNDKYLQLAHVVGICETWLTASQSVDHMFDRSTSIIRCDRAAPDSHGGVLMSIKKTFTPFNAHMLNSTIGVEVSICQITVPGQGCTQVITLYRSPKVAVGTFCNLLSSILVQFTNQLAIIMGDFNDDIAKSNSSVVKNLMNRYGFIQFVDTPTTDHGALLDHVYYNGCIEGVVVYVVDCYYSDHDVVYVAIPRDS